MYKGVNEMIRYSKSTEDVIGIKKDYTKDNSKYLQNVLKINEKYIEQPIRLTCKICENIITSDYDFISHNVPYVFCTSCGHVNGLHQETNEFLNWLYFSNAGENYGSDYYNLYQERVNKIYQPKILFLRDVIDSKKDSLSLIDIGTGAGHLVAASLKLGLMANGIDVNQKLVDLGNSSMEKLYGFNDNKLSCVTSEKDMLHHIKNSKSSVISFMCTLNHCQDVSSYLRTFHESEARYLFLQVPMFSISSLISISHSEIYPRVLGGAHTHIFTENSINYLLEKFKLKILGEWRFGSDILDLKRTLMNSVNASNSATRISEQFEKLLSNKVINSLQSVLDQNHVTDEIHFVLEK